MSEPKKKALGRPATVHMPRETILAHASRLFADHGFERTSLQDVAKSVGLSVNVFVSVSLTTQTEKALKDFERAAAERPEVMECYLMTGDSDYLLRVVVPDLEAYERFVMDFTKIQGIAQIRSSFALRPVKQGAALPLAPHVPLPR